ncbi:MAG: substrate-binding domain-containing protein, partial [Dehalococcoidales bacterium]|nr:substrate-binding domain-containing protein [Dehalococcoidales bacterium]
VNCDWDATKAYDATKDLLVAHPDLKGIFACNDTMALAAVEALTAENVTDVYVYGVDFTEEARASIKEGGMTGTMSYSSAKYTSSALQMAIMLDQGQEISEPVYLPLTLANVENIYDLDGWR